MKKSTNIIFGLILVSLIGFNLNYILVSEVSSDKVTLKMHKSNAVAQPEDPPPPAYFDEETRQCSCGAWGFKCIPVENQASCNVSGQINCEVACSGGEA